ncbi:MAG: hypothetical protein CVU50_02095 [Candidatus Cloacimonetes bacterium HGW-Cloacimonetes-3]|jgi:hypothetical protein|nr:MAG: hypothetical protein CVU50_02095 [Candidatus Cloacimonetes bacterium HGW-Cloacimonetes-3]
MLSFNRDTRFEYHCGLGHVPVRKFQQTYSSLISCLGGGALCFRSYPFGAQIATTSGGSSE